MTEAEERHRPFFIPSQRFLERIAKLTRGHEIHDKFARLNRHAFRIEREAALGISPALLRAFARGTIAEMREGEDVAEAAIRCIMVRDALATLALLTMRLR